MIDEKSPKVRLESFDSGKTHRLLLHSVSVHDEGEYTCVLGDQESTAELTVIGKKSHPKFYTILQLISLMIYQQKKTLRYPQLN